MKRFLALAALAAAGCASPPTADSFEPSSPAPRSAPEPRLSRGLGLEEALELADRWHPELAESRARWEAAKHRATQAGAWPNPALVGRIEAAGTEDQAEVLAGVSQSLPLGGRLGAAERAEEMEAERLALEREARRRTVRSRVHSAFATALFADRALAMRSEGMRDAETALGIARSLVAAGEALPTDSARAEMELARAGLERDRAEWVSREARIGLEAAIGRSGLRIASVEGSLESALELPTLESLAGELERHPALLAADAGVRARREGLELARTRRIPDLNLDLLYRRLEGTEEDGFDVGVSVTLPVFDRNGGAIREARSERRAAEARRAATAIELARDLRQFHARLARALVTARTLKEVLLVRHEEIARASEVRYDAGDASLAEVLPVRRERLQARLDYLEALREVMEAWAALNGLAPKRPE